MLPSLLHAALLGYEHQLKLLREEMERVRQQLGRAGMTVVIGGVARKPLSAAARKRISAAQKQRWAAWKKAQHG